MSYYVQTSASNLGNILSTESISPASLYARRSYGYRFFDRIDGDADNAIHIHKEVPPRPKDEEAAVTMVMELDETLVRKARVVEDGTLWTSETIRIDPVRCNFLFYTETDLNEAFNGVQRNIEAKLADRYRESARTQEQGGSTPTLFDEREYTGTPSEGMLPEDAARFERLDRIKGAIFGYCLGFCYSLPRDKRDRDMRDDFVSYMATVDRMVNSVTQAPIEQLEDEKRKLEQILYKYVLGGEFRSTRQETDETFDLGERLKRLGRLTTIELPPGIKSDSFKLNSYRADLEERIHKAKDDWKGATRLRDEYKPTVLQGDSGPVLQLPSSNGGLVDYLVNRLIRADILGRTRRTLGYPFALECGKAVKKYVGDIWEGSGEREYINRLLPHLNTGDEFDPMEDCGISDKQSLATLRLLAHLCERADNAELDNYYRHLLIRCHVADYALPFCMWGAAFGFSMMPKTLLDTITPPAERCARALFDEVLDMLDDWDGVS